MKFTSNNPSRHLSEAVAYFDRDGDLRIRNMNADVESFKHFILYTSGECGNEMGFYPDTADDGQVFYPGDTITITF